MRSADVFSPPHVVASHPSVCGEYAHSAPARPVEGDSCALDSSDIQEAQQETIWTEAKKGIADGYRAPGERIQREAGDTNSERTGSEEQQVVAQSSGSETSQLSHMLTATAAKPNPFVLKKLTQRHKDMVVLSLQGLSREKVGEFCGCTPQYVTMINRQPLARAYIVELEEHLDIRLRGLYSKSIDAIQAGLTGPRISDKLAAAQLHLSTIGKLKPPAGASAETAEDVVAAMLVQNSNIQVNIRR